MPDITMCDISGCPIMSCSRNPDFVWANPYWQSYGKIYGTTACPLFENRAGCMSGCVHAEKYMSEIQNVDEAIKCLVNDHCDHCIFSDIGED